MQKGKTLEDSGSNTGQSRPSAGPKWAKSTPFDLAAIRTIYSSEAKSHTSTHSPSAAEEQRREGHHLREERVELVD
jgi:hypothetical protein